jgi:hypothetical protein
MTRSELAKQAGPICGKCGRPPGRSLDSDYCGRCEHEVAGHYLETETAEQVAARLECEIEEEEESSQWENMKFSMRCRHCTAAGIERQFVGTSRGIVEYRYRCGECGHMWFD